MLGNQLPDTTTSQMPPLAPTRKRNHVEQYFYDRFGEDANQHQQFYHSDEELNNIFHGLGVPEEQLGELLREYDERWNAMMDPTGPGLQLKGFKPGDARLGIGYEDVHIIRIPGEDDLAIRFYPGSLDSEYCYMIDFFHCGREEPINSRNTGFEIHIAPPPGTTEMQSCVEPLGHLWSWEIKYGCREEDIPPGEERFSLPEGTTLSWFVVGEIILSSGFR
ncbi:hypothetical protein JVT61DRAFT_15252 [Boletus reticuloceps]|uniref:Uncharacterized protein n=1 Tax=Boletus reticuloceps TaxID=495285 RepID=A0A8I2YU66_9AGAM|nr:hypothetical protein JVT61DRAFT_15252 [Boletus reticuloceps]